MDEQEIIEKLKSEGYDKIWIHDAEPNEVDEEHQHDYDTRLVVLSGQIEITAPMNEEIRTLSHSTGSDIEILKNTPHSAKVGSEGCCYVVAEKH